MIKVENLTPDYYYKNSRDFQFLGRLFEVLFNSLLTDIDLIKEMCMSDNMDLTMVELTLYTLGFEPKHDYTNINMLALVQIFKTMMKLKGTKTAIEYAVNLLLRSQYITDEFKVEIPTIDRLGIRSSTETNFDELYTVKVYLPTGVKGTILLEDLFDYILPSGFTYNIYFTNLTDLALKSNFTTSDAYEIKYGKNDTTLFGQLFSTKDLNNDDANKTYSTVVVNADSIDENDLDITTKPENESE